MYLIKASDVHLPANMINNMGNLSLNVIIIAPDVTEWVPIYFAFNPSFAYLISVTANLNSFRRSSWVMFLTIPYFMTEHMGVSRFDPGRIWLF